MVPSMRAKGQCQDTRAAVGRADPRSTLVTASDPERTLDLLAERHVASRRCPTHDKAQLGASEPVSTREKTDCDRRPSSN
jgi:hypothetical protein